MTTQLLVRLADGNTMPQLGLGVWRMNNEQVVSAIDVALETGYRAIDTAAIYANEAGVGQALKNAALPRNELFITTKLWNEHQDNVERALAESLKKLQLDYVDLYLIHWPIPNRDKYVTAWKKIAELKNQGLIKSIGVSNFQIPHLQRLIDETGIMPVVNQIELHPLLQQKTMQAWNMKHHIATESWSPLARGGEGIFDTPLICQLAQKYGKTPAQIIIRWHLDHGLIVVPKSVTPARIKENFSVFDFMLNKDELHEIAQMDCGKRLGPDPDTFDNV